MRVRDVAGYLRQAEQVSIVMGAGASRTAGIPTAPVLVKTINERFGHCLGDLSDEERLDYGRTMGALSPADRKSLIQPLLDSSEVNWGHIALACITRAIKVKRVLTFNFDLILERAASLVGIHLPVYDFGVAPTRELSGLAAPAIFHLHGQSYGLRLMNSDSETIAHKEVLRPLLADSLRNHLTIVIGYSGEADAAFTVMEDEFNSHQNLIWLGYETEPKPHLAQLLSKDYAFYVGGCDFDRTMIDLAETLGCWPPEVIKNPPRHILSQLKEVSSYPVGPEVGKDLLTSTRRRLNEAADGWEGSKDGEAKAQEALISGTAPENPTSAVPSEGEKEARAWSYARNGISKLNEAKQNSAGTKRDILYNEAVGHFEKALKMKPDLHQIQAALASTYMAQSRYADRPSEKGKLEKLALDYFRRSYEQNPDYAPMLAGYAHALTMAAERKKGAAAKEMIAQAGQYFEKLRASDDVDSTYLAAYLNYLLVKNRVLQDDENQTSLLSEAELIRRRLREATGKPSYNGACLLALRGEYDSAIEELVACEKTQTLPNVSLLIDDPDLDGLRDDERFMRLLDRRRRENAAKPGASPKDPEK